MKARFARRLEIAAAWVAAGLAWCAGFLGLVGPLLGGRGPGMPGPVGFASETIVALWGPLGLLTAILAGALLLRRLWWPAAALSALVLVILVPELRAIARSPAVRSAGDLPSLRVASVNLGQENREEPDMEEALRQIDADVLVLLEFTRSWARRLEERFADDYPHRWLAAAPESPGLVQDGLRIAVWSRLPPAGEPEVRNLSGVNAQIRVPLLWRERPFALYGIHPWKPYPFTVYSTAWRQRRELLDWMESERLPVVVAGDYNAPPRSSFILRLRRLGLIQAAESVLGYSPPTWPMGPGHPGPSPIAIDHVMHSDAFVAVAFERGPLTHSDHAPILTELVWRAE